MRQTSTPEHTPPAKTSIGHILLKLKLLLLTGLLCCAIPKAVVAQVCSPPLGITISGPSAICDNQTATLSVPATTGYSYNWVAGNGGVIISGATTNAVTIFGGGSYTVTVSTPDPCSETATTNVLEYQTPAITLSPTTSTVCEGSLTTAPITFNTSVAGGATPYTYNWSTPNGSFGSTSTTGPTAQAFDGGTYSVTVTTAEGCSNLGIATITEAAVAQADAGADQFFCANNLVPVQLAGSVINASGGTWSGGAGTFSSTTSLNADYAPHADDISAGSVTLTLTPTSLNGCTPVPDQVTLYFNQVPVVNAGTDHVVCLASSSVQLAGTVTHATGGVWSTSGSGSFSPNNTSLNAIYVPSLGDTDIGVVTLTLFSTGNGGCAGELDQVDIFFTNTASFSGTQPFIDVCAGFFLSSTLSLETATAYTSAATYNWSLNGSTLLGHTGPTLVASSAGTYTVTGDFGGCMRSATIVVSEEPVPDLTVTPDVILCADAALPLSSPVTLEALTSAPAPTYTWTLLSGGPELSSTNTLQVTTPESYRVVVHAGNCQTTAIINVSVGSGPCIIPLITPPPGDGKDEVIKGAELTSLAAYFPDPDFDPEAVKDIFIIDGDDVYVEVIAKPGKKAELMSSLLNLGLTDVIDNGAGSLVISGKFPIADLPLIDGLTTLVNYARPLFPALNNAAGINTPTTQGDAIVRADLVRAAYGLDGTGVKIGVISDSYNHLPNSPAAVDISAGNLPGAGNPNGYGLDVQVMDDGSLRRGTDEGRAMLQIVHDIAPKAELVFRTGCKTPGDMAEGIRQLQQAGCNIIVDDLTHITEPYYRDGQIARAVDFVTEQGTSYFTAAGNFGSKAFEGTFANASLAPNQQVVLDNILGAGFTEQIHDFGSGEVFQDVVLRRGQYIVVLQWEDAVYTNGELAGTQTDLDLYLLHNDAQSIIGYNRTNYGGDPLEVLTFEVTADYTPAKLLVAKAIGNAVKFKYIVFRGEMALNTGTLADATIAGHANAAGAITVGAVRPPITLTSDLDEYLDTGVIPMSYTSKGGTPVNGVTRQKPDLAAPNGVLTTVRLGLDEQPNEQYYRFYGTSAAAPHAAAVGALLMQGRRKFLNQDQTSPEVLRGLLTENTFAPNPAHSPLLIGAGLMNAEAAMRSFANPDPQITNVLAPANIVPEQQISVTIQGFGFMEASDVFVDEQLVPAANITFNSTNSLTVLITPETTTSGVRVYNPPVGGAGGGSSNIWSLGTLPKPVITVVAHDKTKKFGHAVPDFTFSVLVNGVAIPDANLTPAALASVGIGTVTPVAKDASQEPVSALSPVTTAGYPIIPKLSLLPDSANFVYERRPGLLRVTKLPLKITPQNINLTYGQKIDTVELLYEFDQDAVANTTELLEHVHDTHAEQLTDTIAVVNTRVAVDMAALVNEYYVTDLGFLASGGVLGNTRVAVDMAALVNGGPDPDAQKVIDLPVESLLFYRDQSNVEVPLVNTRVAVDMAALVNTRVAVDMAALVNAGPLDLASGITNTRVAVDMAALVNTDPGPWELASGNSALLNSSSAYNDRGRSNVAMIIDTADFNLSGSPEVPSVITRFASVNVITGYTVGEHYIMPGALLSENFDITYGYGILTVEKAPLVATTATATRYIFKGDPLPAAGFTSTVTGWVGEDSVDLAMPVAILAVGPRSSANPAPYSQVSGAAGIYDIVRVIDPAVNENYTLTTDYDSLFVNPKGIGAVQVRPRLKCVSETTTTVNGTTYNYVAHLEYINDNLVPVYLPSGSGLLLNYITATGSYAANLPQVFMPGTHPVDVPFDGQKLNWTIKTFTASLKSATASDASASSSRCNAQLRPVTASVEPLVKVQPNPTTGTVTVAITEQKLLPAQLEVTDLLGRACRVPVSQNAGGVDLDLGAQPQGVYLIRITLPDAQHVLRVVKE